jgi:hypothetical protein
MATPENLIKNPGSFFVALIKHADEDTPHNLACPSGVKRLQAETREQALEEAKEIAFRHRAPGVRLESMQIFEVLRSMDAPLSAWYQKFDADAAKEAPPLPIAERTVSFPEPGTSLFGRLKRRLGFEE